MESIVIACITGVVTMVGVILSNSKSRAVMEVKPDALTEKVEKLEAAHRADVPPGRGAFGRAKRHRDPQGKGGLT